MCSSLQRWPTWIWLCAVGWSWGDHPQPRERSGLERGTARSQQELAPERRLGAVFAVLAPDCRPPSQAPADGGHAAGQHPKPQGEAGQVARGSLVYQCWPRLFALSALDWANAMTGVRDELTASAARDSCQMKLKLPQVKPMGPQLHDSCDPRPRVDGSPCH